MTTSTLDAPTGVAAEPWHEQLAFLAQTFADSAQPVWIHDLDGRCLYANPTAQRRPPSNSALRFELFDHAGIPRARLITIAA